MTRRFRRTRRTPSGRLPGLGRLGARGVRVPRLGHRRRDVLEPVLLRARADREPRLARRAVPAAGRGVRRGRAGARLRGRGDGDVPVRHRLRRAACGHGVDRRAELAVRGRCAGRRRDPRRGDHRDRARRQRTPAGRGRHRRCLRLAGRDRAVVPDRPPARVRGHVDRAARRRGGRSGARRPEPACSRRGGVTRPMMGPEIPLYLTVASFLFATGALGVLLRRNPLIVLLSLEIMLNGANLAFISFARRLGDGDGQIFAVTVMAVAASEGVVGLGLAVALLITLAGARIPRRVAGFISTLSVAVSFVASVIAFFALHDRPTDDRIVLSEAWTWLAAGDFRVPLDILIDPLSIYMMLIVSGVGALIVAYSIGYMDGDAEERRYFAYMSLFVFSMLLLVQSANFVVLLVGWGLVGLSSYLLIGYHHERPSAVAAAKKAFIMNALGDATMALAIFLLFWNGAPLGLSEFEYADGTSQTVMTLVALGMLGGAVAKSAQLPLHTWLPDAMEGPTPVSALIHAATMVTAGVYLIVRTHSIFQAAPNVQHLSAIIGGVTIVVAGVIALVQWDIKRVIA